MKQEKRLWPVLVGAALCVLTLVFSVILQREGYVLYLNSDMASEILLARQQADSMHPVEMNWLYSTEIHTLHMNLLYAIAFLFTDSYFAARVIGNTVGFLFGMASCVYLCRKLGLSYGRALAAAALLPLAASALYAANMTIGGYYIVHLTFGFIGAGLWLDAANRAKRRGGGLMLALGYMAFMALEGLLSVRYVLCFVCPMLVTAVLDFLFAPEQGDSLRDRHERFFGMTVLGFLACGVGYVLSEILYPRLFTSGTGSASSFMFNPLDGPAMVQSLSVVFADFLKLLGWRGGVSLFSVPGIVNLCVAASIVLGAMMTVRVVRRLNGKDEVSCAQRYMIQYAAYAFAVNLFCFVFVEGTYLNRYLILAVLFFVPVLAVVLSREKNKRLAVLFCLVFSVGLGASSMQLLKETMAGEREARARGQHMMDAAQVLTQQGYTHGYGGFWHVRVMQERTQGALTFTGVANGATEAGALSPVTLGPIRWLEMDHYADMDVCPGKTFLLLDRAQEEELAAWLAMTGAPEIYRNEWYAAYGFESSQALTMQMLLGGMTLENAEADSEGTYTLHSGGRLRIPPGWREAGSYSLSLTAAGAPAEDSVMQVYAGRNFTLIAELPISEGANELDFALQNDDKYLMIQVRAGASDSLEISDLTLSKAQ